MAVPGVSLVDAAPEHFDAIVRIERAEGAGSVVALTEGHALQEALDRGHGVVVALRDSAVAGWIWFTVELRGGENVGQILRVAVDRAHRRAGIGSLLVDYARATFASGDCARARLVVSGADAGARAFFERCGFAVDAMTMDLPL